MKNQTLWSDFIEGWRAREFWMTFGLNDVISKYRRSKLGQFWITFSVAVFIFVIGGLYQGAFGANAENYLAYMSVGYILWQYISAVVNGGGGIIGGNRAFFLQRRMPISAFSFRYIYREVIVFLHHIVLLPIVFIYLKLWPGFMNIGLSLLGFTLVVFTSIWVTIFLGIISLRYRDLPPIIQSLMLMAFFATPIIWVEHTAGRFGQIINTFNPFTYFLAIVRDPLLGKPFSSEMWLTSIAISVAMIIVTFITYCLTRNKIAYWL